MARWTAATSADPPEGMMAGPTRPLAHGAWAGRWLGAARAGGVALAVCTIALFLGGLAPRYAQLVAPPPPVLADLARLGASPKGYALFLLTVEALVVAGFAATATILFRYRSREPMVLLVALTLVTFGAMNGAFVRSPWALAALHPALDLACRALAWFAHVLLVLFFLLFPDGRFVPPWTRWLAPVLALALAAWIFSPRTDFLAGDVGPALLHPATIPLLGGLVALQVYRYLRVSDEVQRQQTRWVVFGVAAGALGSLEAIFAGYGFAPEIRPTVNATAVQVTGALFASLALLAVPLSFGIAVTRHRLFEIDFFINRALVYGALTGCVVAGYALVVGLLSQLFRTGGNVLISLVATGIVALLFQPLRERVQHGVNRLMYGERDDPAAVISQLGRRLEASLAPHAVLLAIVETVAMALKLPYAAVALRHGSVVVVAAEYPAGEQGTRGRAEAPTLHTLPLTYQGENVGELRLAPRPGEAGFGPADRRLLDELARQAGVAVHAVRLAADLQRSREQLVAAREEERRRLRRDLHDGLGPRLASLTLKLESLRDRLAHDPVGDAMVADLTRRTQDAVADIRRLVYALRPPALDELGLVSALRESAAQYGYEGHGELRIAVEAPDELPPLPAAVEVAAYRIAQEALTNVVRHAGARRCAVRLARDVAAGTLCIEIEDDGRGLGPDHRSGVGLSSMRERAEELGGAFAIEPIPGGGTRVRAELPLGSRAVGQSGRGAGTTARPRTE